MVPSERLALSRIRFVIQHHYYSTSNKIGVVVTHDIFGFSIPNTKYVVDFLAENGVRYLFSFPPSREVEGRLSGFHASMPDFYRSDPGPRAEEDPLSGDGFSSGFGKILTPEFWAKYDKDVASVVDDLKSHGCEKVSSTPLLSVQYPTSPFSGLRPWVLLGRLCH